MENCVALTLRWLSRRYKWQRFCILRNLRRQKTLNVSARNLSLHGHWRRFWAFHPAWWPSIKLSAKNKVLNLLLFGDKQTIASDTSNHPPLDLFILHLHSLILISRKYHFVVCFNCFLRSNPPSPVVPSFDPFVRRCWRTKAFCSQGCNFFKALVDAGGDRRASVKDGWDGLSGRKHPKGVRAVVQHRAWKEFLEHKALIWFWEIVVPRRSLILEVLWFDDFSSTA